MKSLSAGDRVRVEFEGAIRCVNEDGTYEVRAGFDSDAYADWMPAASLKRIGAKVKPNQVWQRDGERFYVRGAEWLTTHASAPDVRPGVDLISFATNRRAFHLPTGGGSLEDEGFELILDVEESE